MVRRSWSRVLLGEVYRCRMCYSVSMPPVPCKTTPVIPSAEEPPGLLQSTGRRDDGGSGERLYEQRCVKEEGTVGKVTPNASLRLLKWLDGRSLMICVRSCSQSRLKMLLKALSKFWASACRELPAVRPRSTHRRLVHDRQRRRSCRHLCGTSSCNGGTYSTKSMLECCSRLWTCGRLWY